MMITGRQAHISRSEACWQEGRPPCHAATAEYSELAPFSDQATADIWCGQNTKDARLIPHTIHRVARRKIKQLLNATRLNDLKSPPKNKLEAMTKELAGYHSIRINDQWRLVFNWTGVGPTDVSIRDYHNR